jgi:protein TonB
MMKRFGSAVLIGAVALSLVFHFALLRFLKFEEDREIEKPLKYEVSLKYYEEPVVEQPKQPEKKVRRQKKREEHKPTKPLEVPEIEPEPVEEIVEEAEETAIEEEAETGKTGETAEAVEYEPVAPVVEEKDDGKYREVLAGLHSELLEKKIYPQAARRRNIEGAVLLFLKLDENGALLELEIVRSSGSTLLDRAALSLIKKVTPYDHGLDRVVSVQIPIRYSLID